MPLPKNKSVLNLDKQGRQRWVVFSQRQMTITSWGSRYKLEGTLYYKTQSNMANGVVQRMKKMTHRVTRNEMLSCQGWEGKARNNGEMVER